MKVYKFGGASVNDPAGIINLAKIVSSESSDLVIVVSAFGKTTNSLERLLRAWINNEDFMPVLELVYNLHLFVLKALFDGREEAKNKIDISFASLKNYLLTTKKGKFDFEYDQIVSYGEIWSTIIVEAFLKSSGMDTKWIDIKESLITDDRYYNVPQI